MSQLETILPIALEDIPGMTQELDKKNQTGVSISSEEINLAVDTSEALEKEFRETFGQETFNLKHSLDKVLSTIFFSSTSRDTRALRENAEQLDFQSFAVSLDEILDSLYYYELNYSYTEGFSDKIERIIESVRPIIITSRTKEAISTAQNMTLHFNDESAIIFMFTREQDPIEKLRLKAYLSRDIDLDLEAYEDTLEKKFSLTNQEIANSILDTLTSEAISDLIERDETARFKSIRNELRSYLVN